jgi:spore germination cell wall hydrolase CwlJ-like protein
VLRRVGIQRLPLLLALILVGSLMPLPDIGIAMRCIVPASVGSKVDDTTPAVFGRSHVAANYTLEERDYLIRTIAFEAPGEPDVGKAAVAHVILNRKKRHKWGDTVKDVVTKPWQFEPWMTRRKEMENLSPDDPRYRKAGRIADAVLGGDVPDPTAGATHFLNPTVVRQRRAGCLPSWARGEGVSIGRHTFYSPDEANAAPHWAGLSFGGFWRFIFHPETCPLFG